MHHVPPATPDPTDTLEDEGFVLLSELRPIIPLHPQHIRKLVRRGEFPAPVRLGGRTAFRRRDIREWARQQKPMQRAPENTSPAAS
jgi:predicted DNA-binding transcriptional regulator AlpA